MNVKGPMGLALVASWNFRVVLAGALPVQDRLLTCGVPPPGRIRVLDVGDQSPEAA
jgi:hypothetical protein